MLEYLKPLVHLFTLFVLVYFPYESSMGKPLHKMVINKDLTQQKAEQTVNIADLNKIKASNLPSEVIEPFAVLTASSLQNLLTQALKVSDNIYPQSSSILTMLAMSFLGSMQCPGLSEKTPCFLAFYCWQNTYNPVFVFHATKTCPLVKNLSLSSKTSANGLLLPFQTSNTQSTWYLYGSKDLLKLISKDITVSAPYLGKKVTLPNDLLTLTMRVNQCDFLIPSLPSYAQIIHNTFIKNDIDTISCAINVEKNDLSFKFKFVVTPSSPLVELIHTIEGSKKQHRSLKLAAEDDIQISGFHTFEAIKTCLGAFSSRNQESFWKNDSMANQVYLWGKCLYPLFVEILDFAKSYFSGNYQCYQNLKREKDLILLQNIGLLELKTFGKTTTFSQNETLITFLENFIKHSLQTQLSSAIQQKLNGSECLRGLNLQLDKAIFTDKQYTIHGLACSINYNAMCLNYPFVFSVYKNYLLYADNLEDLKGLIHRLGKNKLTYVTFPFVQQNFINIGQILQKSGYFKPGMPLVFKTDSSLEIICTTQTKPDSVVIEVKIPLTFDNMFAYLQKVPLLQQQNTSDKKPVEPKLH